MVGLLKTGLGFRLLKNKTFPDLLNDFIWHDRRYHRVKSKVPLVS